MVTILLAACAPAPPPADIRFVREGIVRDGVFEARTWEPGQAVEGSTAPAVPECAPLFHVELEDMSRLAAMGAPGAATSLAFSPDGKWLAIGSDAGSLRVVDGWTGAEQARRSLAEGAVRQVAWSTDGKTLYAGEQSPDATVHALDPVTLQSRWVVPLSAELETSALPPADDVFGVYSLPAVYALAVLDDGSILAGGVHGWTDASGERRNRSRLYRFSPDGGRIGAWPAQGPADAVMLHPVVSGRRAAVVMSRSASGPEPAELPIGGIALVDLDAMALRWSHRFEVLKPHFAEVFAWDAIAIDDRGVLAGLGDGRVFLYDIDGNEQAALSPGVPVLAQGVPIAAGVGFGTLAGDQAFFLTTETNIPFGSADPAARPPTAHPAQYTVHAIGRDGSPRWTRQLDHHTSGIVVSPDGGTLLVGAGARHADQRTDLFGALLFEPATGGPIAACTTEGPVHFRPVFGPDSRRVAMSESPFAAGDSIRGAYRVTVFR